MVRNTTVQQFLTFQLCGGNQAVRSAKHSTAQSGVVETLHPEISDDGAEHAYGLDHIRPGKPAAGLGNLWPYQIVESINVNKIEGGQALAAKRGDPRIPRKRPIPGRRVEIDGFYAVFMGLETPSAGYRRYNFSSGSIEALVGTQNRHLMAGGSHASGEGSYFDRGATLVQKWVIGLSDIQNPHKQAIPASTGNEEDSRHFHRDYTMERSIFMKSLQL